MKAELIGDLKCTLPSPLFNQVEFRFTGVDLSLYRRVWCDDDSGEPMELEWENNTMFSVVPMDVREEIMKRLKIMWALGILHWK
jgi:hypothetical protein